MAPPPNIDVVTHVRIFSTSKKLDPNVLWQQNSTLNIITGLLKNEPTKDPMVTNQSHDPLPITNTDSLIKERTDLAKNNEIGSGFSNLDAVISGKNWPKDTIFAVEPTKNASKYILWTGIK